MRRGALRLCFFATDERGEGCGGGRCRVYSVYTHTCLVLEISTTQRIPAFYSLHIYIDTESKLMSSWASSPNHRMAGGIDVP